MRPFWGQFWDQIGTGRRQDGTKRAIKSSKDPKSCIRKNLQNPSVFQGFWGPKASQESLRRPKKAPKREPKSSKTQQKRDPKMGPEIINFGTNCGTILGAILGPELAPKGDQKWDHFWNTFRRLSGVGRLRFCELNESAAKATVTGIILGKRKGGIRPLRSS